MRLGGRAFACRDFDALGRALACGGGVGEGQGGAAQRDVSRRGGRGYHGTVAGRLAGIEDADRLAVPLPPGTEVTTRVERVAGDRVVRDGAMGRVVSRDGDFVEVEVVGVGRLRYLRSELVPRKTGLLRYARRRERAWEALRGCIVLDAVVGSRAWGLAEEGSDEDRRGVFVLPFPWTSGLVEPPSDLASDDGCRAYWEVAKTIRQALRADPNTLELLFAASEGDVTDELGAELVRGREAFVSLEIYGSFGRYALAQLDRLEHNVRLAEHRSLVVDWLRADASLGLDAAAARLADAAGIAAPSRADAVLRGRDYLKQLYRSLHDQGLLAGSDWAALVAFARDAEPSFELPRDLRPKNAYNLVRLLDLAIRWLESGEAPSLRVPDALRPTLLAIKRGEVALAEVLQMARALTPRLERARGESRLPRRPDVARAEAILRGVRHEAARRWLAQDAGAFGLAAPEPPVARFDDEEAAP